MAELNAIVDLSHDNGLVTFAKAKKTGLLGAIHKATQGTQYPDPKIRSIDLGAANDPVLIQLLVLAVPIRIHRRRPAQLEGLDALAIHRSRTRPRTS